MTFLSLGCSKVDNCDNTFEKLSLKETIERTINQLDFFEQTTLVEAINFRDDTTSSLGIKYKIYMESHNNCRSVAHDIHNIDLKESESDEAEEKIRGLFDRYYTMQLELLENNKLGDKNSLSKIKSYKKIVDNNLNDEKISETIPTYIELQIRLIHYELMEMIFVE